MDVREMPWGGGGSEGGGYRDKGEGCGWIVEGDKGGFQSRFLIGLQTNL